MGTLLGELEWCLLGTEGIEESISIGRTREEVRYIRGSDELFPMKKVSKRGG